MNRMKSPMSQKVSFGTSVRVDRRTTCQAHIGQWVNKPGKEERPRSKSPLARPPDASPQCARADAAGNWCPYTAVYIYLSLYIYIYIIYIYRQILV